MDRAHIEKEIQEITRVIESIRETMPMIKLTVSDRTHLEAQIQYQAAHVAALRLQLAGET